MIYKSQSKKEDNGKPINTKNLERGISIQKMAILKFTSQFVSGRSGSSKTRGGTCATKKHGVMFEPWAQNRKSNLFCQNLYISGWETFLMQNQISTNYKQTHKHCSWILIHWYLRFWKNAETNQIYFSKSCYISGWEAILMQNQINSNTHISIVHYIYS